jgi:hypothetical protein
MSLPTLRDIFSQRAMERDRGRDPRMDRLQPTIFSRCRISTRELAALYGFELVRAEERFCLAKRVRE